MSDGGFFESSLVEQPRSRGFATPRCGLCGLWRKCQSPKMTARGKGRQKVLVLGEAPGSVEDSTGRLFVGKAGQYLRRVLRELDIDLDNDAWMTNTLICRPPGNSLPSARQIEWCRPNFTATLEAHKPIVVVTLGHAALACALSGAWTKIDVLERWVGRKIPLGDYWVCPTWHPSYLRRVSNPLIDRQFKRHLDRAFKLIKRPLHRDSLVDQVELLYDVSIIRAAIIDMHRKGGWLAVDYETTCLKPEWPKARIFSCALSNGQRTISFPWLKGVERTVGGLLLSARTRKIASNLKFEERWTRKTFGHGVGNWGWDTMLAAHCLDNRQGVCSIKFQAFVELGVPIYNERVVPYLESRSGPYNRIAQAPLKELLVYGGADALLEWRLARRQRKIMGYED